MINTKFEMQPNTNPYVTICTILFVTIVYTNAFQIHVKVGDNLTLQDNSSKHEQHISGLWYYQTKCTNGLRYTALGIQLCQIPYTNISIHTLSNKCGDFVRYQCKNTTLHLYNITTTTPTSYTLSITYPPDSFSVEHFFLNITCVTCSKPTKTSQRSTHPTTISNLYSSMVTFKENNRLRLQSSSAATATPIIVTVSIVIVMTCFWYLYYRHRRRPML